MKEIYYLFKRNVWLYLRDYVSVFFSILSMLIVLALMVIFLGKMNSENLVEMLAQLGGARDTAVDEKNAAYLIQMWTLAGILEVNAVTIPMTVMGTMVHDEANKRLASFYLAPVSRSKITLGYILSSWLVGAAMCVLTLILGELYLVLSGHPLLDAASFLTLLWMILLNALVYAAIAYLFALFVHSDSAWGSMLTIVGTLVGFLGAIYLPMSMLPDGVAKVLKCLPILHGSAMMREVCTRDAVTKTFAGLPDIAGEMFREQMGVTVFWGENKISLQHEVFFLVICATIAIISATAINKRHRLRDR